MRFIRLLILLLVFAASPVFAKKCVSGNCTDGIGTQLFTNGFLFHGEFQNGTWNGYSVQETRSGTNCEGLTKNGRGEGVQFCIYNSGKSFFGHYERGRFGGFGMFLTADGQLEKMGEYAAGKLRFETEGDVKGLVEELKQMRADAPIELIEKLPDNMRDYSFDDLIQISRIYSDAPQVSLDKNKSNGGSLDWAKKGCSSLGLTKGDESFSDCVVDMIEVYERF